MDFISIRNKLIDEANTSPNMLSDLAGLETYISESYNNRSFIELLQNADDAKSSQFLIAKTGNYLLVANNGKTFDDKDLISLCRSASSSKYRGNSIGYRGIGFKSVVNFAHEIHVISGEMRITFSKELTKAVVTNSTNVPLIRIPHPIRRDIYNGIKPIISRYKDEGYTTFFIFTGLIVDQIEDDYKKINNSSLLFLNHIIEIKNELIGSIITIKKENSNEQNKVEIFDSSLGSAKPLSSWLLYKSSVTSIAFMLDKGLACVLPRNKALVYSFLPTEDVSGLGVLVNSDFSTDPSRRHLIKDDSTKHSVREICNLYKTIFLRNIFKDNVVSQSIIKSLIPFEEPSLVQFTGNHFEKIFIDEIKNILKLERVVYKPSYLNSKDFNLIVNKLNYKSINVEDSTPTLSAYLKYLGARELSIDDFNSSKLINSVDLTISGCIQIASRLIKESIYNFEFKGFDLINMKLFYYKKHRKSLVDIDKENGCIDEAYFSSLIDSGLSKNDFESLFKKNNLSNLLLHLNEECTIENITTEKTEDLASENNDKRPFGNNSSNTKTELSKFGDWYNRIHPINNTDEPESFPIPNWRTAEYQVLHLLNRNGFHLTDVSKQNLGYDLEGDDPFGNHIYVEVKSINYPGQSFRMTNNEYAIAQVKGKDFFIAVVCLASGKLKLALFPDPTNRLKFNRQCVQWTWECSNYTFQSHIFEI